MADGRQTTRAHRALERATVARATDVAQSRVPAIDEGLVAAQVDALAGGLAERGGVLAPEQERAVELGCGDRQLVVIVGQAGTGKSTALLGVARAHKQAGRRIVVASTGAQAAERLAGELREGGVEGRGYSTTALRVNVEQGRVSLDRGVTVLHDEAALASTREQAWLLGAVRESGARLVMIGDPRQSQAVGAGGLWPVLEQTARGQGGFVELSRIVRAQDPADRRDQAVFRSGQHDRALAGYAERGLVVLEAEQRRVEDRALEAAQADRMAGRVTLVVAETSNEQLDALNARAQAIRRQEGELGEASVRLAGRPYGVHAGDMIVIRAGVVHPVFGAVRNGISGEVTSIDAGLGQATLRLSDGREGPFDKPLLDAAQTRLAYASHPFPAQGQTTDTTHVIATRLSTAEGSYVGLTRARSRTHVYAASDDLDLQPGTPRDQAIATLAERLGRSEPEMPSIRIPLAHEREVEAAQTAEAIATHDLSTVETLRNERDRLRDLVATYPRGAAQAETLLQNEIDGFAAAAAQARAQADHYRTELATLGPLARRGARGQALQSAVSVHEQRAAREQASERDARARLAAAIATPDSPARWDADHPQAREQLAEAEQSFDQTVAEAADRALERPGSHLVRILGERPDQQWAAERASWDRAAGAVERYRIAHMSTRRRSPRSAPSPNQAEAGGSRSERGGRPARASSMRANNSASSERTYGPVKERLARIDGLIAEADRQRALDRGHGWEL